MPKFTLEKTVNAQREIVYDIFSNYKNYEKLFPQYFPSIIRRSIRDEVSVVEEHVNLGGKEFVIMAKHVCKESRLHEVFVIGGEAKGTHIKEKFIEIPEGTKILIDVNLKLKGQMRISTLIGKNVSQDDYVEIVNEFIKNAENHQRKIR